MWKIFVRKKSELTVLKEKIGFVKEQGQTNAKVKVLCFFCKAH
jgi:hypothetical protein